MKAHRTVVLGVLLLLCGVAMPRGSSNGAQAPDGARPAPGQVPAWSPPRAMEPKASPSEAPRFLPDSTVLVRVEDRVIRTRGYVDAYYASYAEDRPAQDSLGRVEFLASMVDKEVLALTALEVNRPMTFEDRLVIREHTERVLANVLYARAVLDSVVVTDEEVRDAYLPYGWQYHLKDILFVRQPTAETVREKLLAHQLRWADAVRRYSADTTRRGSEGDLGWVSRQALDYLSAIEVYRLRPGEISRVFQDVNGFHLAQLVERRKVKPPAFEPMRLVLEQYVRDQRAGILASRLQQQVGREIGVTYDSTNIRFAAAQFKGHQVVTEDAEGPILDLSGSVPEFAAADTARILARHRDGRFTLGDFLSAYNARPVIRRPPVGDFEAFFSVLNSIMLEPYMAELARARGLLDDPVAAAQIAKKREQLMVEHLFEDSVQSKVWIPPQERRRYYEEHVGGFTTYPSVRFAAIVRDSKSGADSVAARLASGERAEAILRADSLQGVVSGSVKERRDDEKGPYHKILFEELRPGQSTVVGPDKEGVWMVLHLIEFDPGRRLAYEEVEHYVDESLQNMRAEAMLKDFIARHRKRYRVETHPELVMRIRLVDPLAH
jgi:PPIC-type peptidyl-prolyl cis-trans isomerase-like protein/parvulin-like peptidyl-prolyl cis-trans isomerase-like protein